MGLEGLTEILIQEGVTTIGAQAFKNCEALSIISLPITLKHVETGAFQQCKALSTIYYPGTQAQWNEIQISGNNGYLKLPVPTPMPEPEKPDEDKEDAPWMIIGIVSTVCMAAAVVVFLVIRKKKER